MWLEVVELKGRVSGRESTRAVFRGFAFGV